MATNEAGDSPASDVSETVTCKPLIQSPSPPVNFTVVKTTKSSVTLMWGETPSSGDNTPVEGYVVEKREHGKKSWKTCSKASFHL